MAGIGEKITSARCQMTITEILIKIKQGCFSGQAADTPVKPREKQSLTDLQCDARAGDSHALKVQWLVNTNYEKMVTTLILAVSIKT